MSFRNSSEKGDNKLGEHLDFSEVSKVSVTEIEHDQMYINERTNYIIDTQKEGASCHVNKKYHESIDALSTKPSCDKVQQVSSSSTSTHLKKPTQDFSIPGNRKTKK